MLKILYMKILKQWEIEIHKDTFEIIGRISKSIFAMVTTTTNTASTTNSS